MSDAPEVDKPPTGTASSAAPPAASATRGHALGVVAAVATTLLGLATVLQPIAIGGYLNGNPSGLSMHRFNAEIIDYLGLACVILVIVAAVRARWGRRPMVMVSVLFVLIAAQTAFGYAMQLAIHVPLGVATVAMAVVVPVRLWRLTTGRSDARRPAGANR